jgi:hypothetical protein
LGSTAASQPRIDPDNSIDWASLLSGSRGNEEPWSEYTMRVGSNTKDADQHQECEATEETTFGDGNGDGEKGISQYIFVPHWEDAGQQPEWATEETTFGDGNGDGEEGISQYSFVPHWEDVED